MDDDELERAATAASGELQRIQDALGRQKKDAAKLRFPRGWIRYAREYHSKYWYVKGEVVRRNLSYAHITQDVFRWLVIRTDLAGVARDMICKESICLIAAISEALCENVAHGKIGKRHKFKERTRRMVAEQMIKSETKTELDWLWDMRGGVHINSLPDSEMERYSVTDVNRALQALSALHSELEWYCTIWN